MIRQRLTGLICISNLLTVILLKVLKVSIKSNIYDLVHFVLELRAAYHMLH